MRAPIVRHLRSLLHGEKERRLSTTIGILAKAALMALLVVAPGQARAGIAVCPLKQEVMAAPGTSISFCINLANRDSSPHARTETAYLKVMDFSMSPEGAISLIEAGTSRFSASKWIRLPEESVTLRPGEGREVICRLDLPYGARGEYYSAIVVTLAARERTAAGVILEYRIASGVYVRTAGISHPRSAEITDCRVAQVPSEKPPGAGLDFVATLHNSGRGRFKAEGHAKICQPSGRIVAVLPLSTTRKEVLPGDARIFRGNLRFPLPPGQYEARLVFEYGSRSARVSKRVPFDVTPEMAEILQVISARHEQAIEGPDHVLTASPSELRAALAPGRCRTFEIQLSNPAAKPLRVTASLARVESEDSLPRWTRVVPASFLLGPRELKKVKVRVSLPSKALGSHTGEINFIATDPPKGSTRITQLSLPISVEIVGRAER